MDTKTKNTAIGPRTRRAWKKETPQDDHNFAFPEFASDEEREAWFASLPQVKAEVDERLKKRKIVTLRLNQLMVEGFEYLAEQLGVGDGKTLMYIVLNEYLNQNLPKDF
ncbi:MAG: hypothetical protein HY318_16830 [Armatimonadetes bacterium]|nr:hypothetical protein [Armatimonadota bacterium]